MLGDQAAGCSKASKGKHHVCLYGHTVLTIEKPPIPLEEGGGRWEKESSKREAQHQSNGTDNKECNLRETVVS